MLTMTNHQQRKLNFDIHLFDMTFNLEMQNFPKAPYSINLFSHIIYMIIKLRSESANKGEKKLR